MTATDDQALLLEWGLLQDEIVPGLHEKTVRGRPPRACSIGSVEDAASIAVAYQHAEGRRRGSIESYVTAPGREIGFRRPDLREVPPDSRLELFVREDRRWLVDDRIAERVVLEDPPEPVDLVTYRAGTCEDGMTAAVDRVRQGGQLLVIGDDGERPPLDCLDQVASGSAGVVYRKLTPPPAVGDGQGRVGEDGATEDRRSHPVDTLARAREQRRLVESHVQLAASLARRFAHHGESHDDLEQVAMLALVKAARRFDPLRETRFASYATASILGELKRHFRDKAWAMRVPRHLQETYLSVKQVREELTQTLGTEPTVEDIAERLGYHVEDVLDALGAGENFWVGSLDGGSRDEGTIEIPVLDRSFDRALDRLQMTSRMADLDRQEQLVLHRLYFDECTQREVASEIGVSQMQVSRLQSRALSKLRS